MKVERKFLLAMNISSPLNCSVLTDKDEIAVVLKNGRKIKSDLGTIYLYNFKNEPLKKAAIFVKKNIGKAYYRNYIKRIIRFYIRSSFTLFKDYNRVIFFYNCKEKIKYPFLKERVTFAFRK